MTPQEQLDQLLNIIDLGFDEYVSSDIRIAMKGAHQLNKDLTDGLLTDDQKTILADWILEDDGSVTTNRTYNFPSGSVLVGDRVIESGGRIMNTKSESIGDLNSVLTQRYNGGNYFKAQVVDETETSTSFDAQIADDTINPGSESITVSYVNQSNIHIQKIAFKPFGGTITKDFRIILKFDIADRAVYDDVIDYTTVTDKGGGLFEFTLSHPALFDLADIIHIIFEDIELLGGDGYDGTDGIRLGDSNYSYFFPYLQFTAIPIVYQNLATENYVTDEVNSVGRYLGVFADETALNTAYPTGRIGDSATVTSPDNTIWYWNGTVWADSGTGYIGDMLKSVYDPTNVNDDAFDMTNMVEGTTNKIFTDSERTKLSGIEPLAEVNVNADWNAVTGDAEILNKPTDVTDLSIHSATELNDITDAGSGIIISGTERTKLSGIEDGADVNVQSDWDEANTGADSYILNKPTDVTDLSLHNVTELADVTDAGSGQIITSDERTKLTESNTIQTLLTEPNGTVDADTDITISFVDGTQTFTVQPTGASFDYYSAGVRYNKTSAENIVIDDTEGFVFIYYDGSVLSKTNTFSTNLLTEWCWLASIYWDADNNKQLYFGREYKHTAQMDGKTHGYLHNTVGYALASGGALGDFLVDDTGNNDAHAQFSNEASVCYDEDARFNFSARLKTATLPVYYRTGLNTSNIWRVDETTSFPVITTGTGRAAYNQLTGGSWQLTEAPNNDYILAHVVLTNDTDRPYVVVMGQNSYSILNQAREGALTELFNLVRDGLFGEEFKFVASVIIQTSDSYTNTVKSRIRSTEDGGDYVDWRLVNLTRGAVGGTYDHNALGGLQGGIPTEYYHLTNAELTKLGGIEAGAEVNVQADWTETNTGSDAYIQNKPVQSVLSAYNDSTITIPASDTVIIADTVEQEDNLSYDDLTGYLTINETKTYTLAVTLHVATSGVNKTIETWIEYETATPGVWAVVPATGFYRNYATQDEPEVVYNAVKQIDAGTKLRYMARSNDATAVTLVASTLTNGVVMPSVRFSVYSA